MKKLIYLFLGLLIVACSSDDDSSSDNNEPSNCDVVYLADNGITIKACDDANFGDTGVVNGVTYTVVNEVMLREMVLNEEDVTKVATTKVTDMSYLFYIDSDTNSDFNQNISSWDVSNVTTMFGMFELAIDFNQPIGDWDVSKVTTMGLMFQKASSFNQPIGNWDVSSVTYMGAMFYVNESFNQPIGNWDVSNVTGMIYMFYNTTAFNQNLSSWVVDSVAFCLNFNINTPQWTLPKPNLDPSCLE